MIHSFSLPAAVASSLSGAGQSGPKALAIALAGGLGAVGAGVGIGMVFRAVIDSVAGRLAFVLLAVDQ
jgi:F0F1-type ATP synthase membrane subunit c/vacuolar-type H+-ATPase subunit K